MLTKILINYFNWIDNVLPVGGMVRRHPYVMVFKTTNWCWCKCDHCCENSGPDQPKNYIPAQTIKDYLAQGLKDSYFSREVVFTGGEIISAYKFGDADYVPDLLMFCNKNNIGADIKTNAAWVNTSFASCVFDDMSRIIGAGRPYSLQISLSLDNYHKNSMKNNIVFIEKMSHRANMPVAIHLSTFYGDDDMYGELKRELSNRGVRVRNAIIHNPDSGTYRDVDITDNGIILLTSRATLFDGGRAKNLAEAEHSKFSQFKFLSTNLHVLMAFDSFGNVTLGENSGVKIKTNWRTSNNVARPLMSIRHDLVKNAQFHELRARIFQNWKTR